MYTKEYMEMENLCERFMFNDFGIQDWKVD
jgi:hypothetical protein